MDRLFADHIKMLDPASILALQTLRTLVLEVSAQDVRIGSINECLKWNQWSFVTERPVTGSTIRIDAHRNKPGVVALYFICTSGLVEGFRDIYTGHLEFEGNRAILLDATSPDTWPVQELRHCISLALTRKLRIR